MTLFVGRFLVLVACWTAAAICVASDVDLLLALVLFVVGVLVAPRDVFKGAYTGESGGPGVGGG